MVQSIGLKGVDGTAHLLASGLLPALLSLLFLLIIWLINTPYRALVKGTYVPPPPEEKKEKSFSDLMYEVQMADLIEEAIQQEKEENERWHREY